MFPSSHFTPVMFVGYSLFPVLCWKSLLVCRLLFNTSCVCLFPVLICQRFPSLSVSLSAFFVSGPLSYLVPCVFPSLVDFWWLFGILKQVPIYFRCFNRMMLRVKLQKCFMDDETLPNLTSALCVSKYRVDN